MKRSRNYVRVEITVNQLAVLIAYHRGSESRDLPHAPASYANDHRLPDEDGAQVWFEAHPDAEVGGYIVQEVGL